MADQNKDRPTAAVEASGSEREADAWKWLGQLYPNDAPSDLAYDANEMVDAFLAGSGRSDRMAKALERIADEQQHRSGYCQTDITVEPALTAEEAQTVARDALSTTPARAEAQDEGVAVEKWVKRALIYIEQCVQAAEIHFPGVEEDPADLSVQGFALFGLEDECDPAAIPTARLRAHPSPPPAADEDRVRIAVEALEKIGSGDFPDFNAGNNNDLIARANWQTARSAVAALKSTAAKEGDQ